jgi:hypothetical protein
MALRLLAFNFVGERASSSQIKQGGGDIMYAKGNQIMILRIVLFAFITFGACRE